MQTVAAAPAPDIVIPDCCNIGVIFRTLLCANLVVLLGILLRTVRMETALREFLEACVLVEVATLLSLMGLCALRRILSRRAAWVQRLACALVPALITGAIIRYLSGMSWIWDSFAHLTIWKGALLAALLGAVLQHYFEMRTRAFSPTLVEARLQALQARIRPHFLFNSLNAVLALIRTEPRRAEATLEDLADLFRMLMRDPRSMTTLENELALCRQYLAVEQVRLGERLRVDWQIDNLSQEHLRKARIPVLLLQPLLENAVHHGVEPVAQPVLIQVLISRSVDRIQIMVRNPVHAGAVVESGNHMALNNIRERLALLYDVEAQLLTSSENGTFEVRLRFPYVTHPL